MTTLTMTPTRRLWVNLMAGLAALTLGVGIVAPVMTLKKLVWIKNTFSLGSGILALASEGQILLFILLGLFSVVFPIAKIGVLFLAANRPGESVMRWLKWLNLLGKWSMLDVFVVAVLLATIKLGALAEVSVHYGLYAFAASVILTMIGAHLAKKWLTSAKADPV